VSHDYAQNRATADRLLAQFGALFTLVKPVNVAYDPTSGAMAPVDGSNPTTVATDGIGVVLHYTDSEMANTAIQQGDRKLIISVTSMSGVVPVVGDSVEVGADTFRIVSLETLAPAGTSVIYTAQIRK
jgi:hypothetical protein